MKTLMDGTRVPDRLMYYLLDYYDGRFSILEKLTKGKISFHIMTKKDINKLLDHALEDDRKLIK